MRPKEMKTYGFIEIVERYTVFAIFWDENRKDGLASGMEGLLGERVCTKSVGSKASDQEEPVARPSCVNGPLSLSRTAPFHGNALSSEAACEIHEHGIAIFQCHGVEVTQGC